MPRTPRVSRQRCAGSASSAQRSAPAQRRKNCGCGSNPTARWYVLPLCILQKDWNTRSFFVLFWAMAICASHRSAVYIMPMNIMMKMGMPCFTTRPAKMKKSALHSAITPFALNRRRRARLIYVALTRAVYHCTLVAGPYTSGSTPSVKQSCSSVLNWLVAGAGRDFADWFAKPPQPEEIAACWQRLAGESLAVEPLPMATAPSQHCSRASSGLANTTAWRARAAQRYLQEDWRIASLTALTTPPPDRILSAATSDAVISASKPFSEDNILRFPRGASAGQCLHRLFEYADLSTPCDWPAAIERTLREYPELARRNDDDRLSAMMMAMLNDVAASELIPGLRLNAVESACQLSELEFIFPVASLDLSALR